MRWWWWMKKQIYQQVSGPFGTRIQIPLPLNLVNNNCEGLCYFLSMNVFIKSFCIAIFK